MHSYLTLASSLILSAISTVSAMPQAEGAAPQVTIYDEPNFVGEQVTFAADGTCATIFPWIESLMIPEGQDIFCQLFDNAECTGEGADVIVASKASFTADEIFPGVICNVLV